MPASSPPRACDAAFACVVIPVFNHARTVGEVVRGSLQHASTVLVCDDGSTDGSGEQAREAGAELITLPVNQGKGVALAALFAEAARRGFRWAICIDADGQHLPDDLPKIAATASREPSSLVVGSRDLIKAGAPASSEFGRKFSNFWIWFESGVRIDDSQCGLRAYPLPECLQLGLKRKRYDFEAEILLRAAWAGLSIRSVPVGVLYPKDRVTHFRPYLDNTRITLVNTFACLRMALPIPLGPKLRQTPRRLGLSLLELRRWAWLGGAGPLWRLAALGLGALGDSRGPLLLVALLAAVLGVGALPVLAAAVALGVAHRAGIDPVLAAGVGAAVALAFGWLERRGSRELPRSWTGRSRGGVFGHWFFVQLSKHLGLGPTYAALHPVAFYFLFAAAPARKASEAFLDRAVGPLTGLRRFWRSRKHFLAFARTLADKALLATQGPGVFALSSRGTEHLRDAATSGKGAVLVTAHLGNWDVAGELLHRELSTPLSIVLFEGEDEQLARYLERSLGPKPKVISVGRTELAALDILRALRAGELVAIQGDRSVDDRVIRLPFLGQEAAFPLGPYLLAAISGAPLIFTFSVQVGPAAYQLVADPPRQVAFLPGADREAQMREWASAYVDRLEQLVREHPYQWFNFFDFWNARPPTP